MKNMLTAFACTLLFGISAAAAGSLQVTEKDFEGRWPFTVPSGTLACTRADSGAGMITFGADGKTYAVNGPAAEEADPRGWLPLKEIWKSSPGSANKMNLGPIILKGLPLCSRK
jgi:hypothetical protein